jgi:uncharacterized protein with von Willebrand factor type A (vWA) domain
MEVTLGRFIAALRHADLRVSPAETLDALAVVNHIGIHNPRLLRDALALTLAKSVEEKRHFSECYERFFNQLAFRTPAKQSFFKSLDAAEMLAHLQPHVSPELLAVVEGTIDNRRDGLAHRMELAAREVGLEEISSLREKSSYAGRLAAALGAKELEALLATPPDVIEPSLHALNYVRHYLASEARAYVENQYRLRVDASGRRAILEAAIKGNLTQVSPEYHGEVQRVVGRLANTLVKEHRRRQRRASRGALDIHKTLRANLAFDEALFNLVWRRKKREKATVFAICDVSGSVSRVARFLLLLLYGLTEVLPNIRTFAFSNALGEVTALFKDKPIEEAIETTLFDWGKGNTDYARAFGDFRELAIRDLDNRATVVVLGDARNNYYDSKPERLKEISNRAGQVLWLNPESRDSWGEGDSEMLRYSPHCFEVARCNSLTDLERFADKLIAAQRS